MAKITIAVGIVLIVLGAGVYASIAPHAPTSLIPAFFGLIFVVLGTLANTPDTKRRALFMHIAVTFGLIGFLLPFLRSVGPIVRMLQGRTVLRPLAAEESMAMALICLVFTILCVRNFIEARRTRLA